MFPLGTLTITLLMAVNTGRRSPQLKKLVVYRRYGITKDAAQDDFREFRDLNQPLSSLEALKAQWQQDAVDLKK